MDNLSDVDNHKVVKSYKRKNKSVGYKIDCSKDGRTKASFQHDTDINNIIAKFQKTGILENARDYGDYADLTNATDYQDYMNKILDAQDMFESLPAKLRQDFNHDPAQFLDFVHNPENRDKMREYGLLKKEADDVERRILNDRKSDDVTRSSDADRSVGEASESA